MHTIINPYRDPFGPRPLTPNPYNPYPYNPPNDSLSRINELKDYVSEIKPIDSKYFNFSKAFALLTQNKKVSNKHFPEGDYIVLSYFSIIGSLPGDSKIEKEFLYFSALEESPIVWDKNTESMLLNNWFEVKENNE